MKHRYSTLAYLSILLLFIAGSWEWCRDMWRQFNINEKLLTALIAAVVIGGALTWALYPIVWQWANYLLTITG